MKVDRDGNIQKWKEMEKIKREIKEIDIWVQIKME